MENVDDNFINQLRCLIEEYGYQLPMETEKDAVLWKREELDGLQIRRRIMMRVPNGC